MTLLFGAAVFAPLPSDASVLSILGGFFGKKAEKETLNSQTVSLLKASLSSENAPQGGGDITIVDDMALLPEMGLLGASDIPSEPQTDQIIYYTVLEDDTLSQIAKMFGVSVNTIIWANDLRGAKIVPGQLLLILPISGIQYTVKNDDTIEKIVKRHKADLNETLLLNGLSLESKLSAGDKIFILDVEGEMVRQAGIGISPPPTSRIRSAGGLFENYYGGSYLRPITGGYISQGFHGYNNTGIDIAAAQGTPIFSVDNGYVIVSRCGGYNGGYGCYAVIQHSDKKTQALYAHMSRSSVDVGQYAVRGQVIGYVGSTGRSTGPHLHFELRK